MPGRRLVLIVNPAASGGRALAVMERARAELSRRAADFRVVVARSPEHAAGEARAAASSGETSVGVGGDGFVGMLAGALRSTSALAIVPAGRGNDFARVLGVPRDPESAARLALEGRERPVDLATVNGKPYTCIASAGFDSDANRIANEARLVRGNLVYLYAALRALAAWRAARFEVVVDGERHEFSGYAVAVANSKAYGGGMYLAPHAELDDGRLDVMLTLDQPKLAYLRGLPKVFRGAHVTNPGVRFLRGEHVDVRADRPFTVYADGDPIAELPAAMAVERRVLRVIAP